MRTKLNDSPRKVNSKNREKARIKLARFEERIANSEFYRRQLSIK